MPARTGPNRCHSRKGRSANRNRRRRQNNGTPSNANEGNDATGNVANAESNVVVDVAANNAPEEEDLNVAVVAERVADVDLEGGHVPDRQTSVLRAEQSVPRWTALLVF